MKLKIINKYLFTYMQKPFLICVFSIALITFLLFQGFNSISIALSYLLGIYVFRWLSCHCNSFNEVFTFFTCAALNTYFPHKNIDFNVGNESILVPAELDQATENLMNQILTHYVTNWYSSISSDTKFVHEIRILMRRCVLTGYRRVSKVELEQFIFKRILPAVLRHLNIYNSLKYGHDLSSLHAAVHSRSAELIYLQNISRKLIRIILPDSDFKCQSSAVLLREILGRSLLLGLSDSVCNPLILTQLFTYCLNGDYDFLSIQKDDTEKVDFLLNFESSFDVIENKLNFRPDIGAIVNDVELRNSFLRYLKIQNADHILQFYVDLKLFIEKISISVLSAEGMDNLYRDAWDIYSVYFSSHSPYCIEFEKDLASPLRKILSKDVTKLNDTTVLIEATENVFQQLEKYCVDFYISNEFCDWLYGRCESSDLFKSIEALSPLENSSERNKSGFELSNKINMIKDALKSDNVLEGQINEFEDCDLSMELGEDAQASIENNCKNMSDWVISIPTIGSRLDPVTNKAYTVFVIQVQSEGNDWVVERRPNDFCTLDMKLTEFHGTFLDSPLPSRKVLNNRTEGIQLFEDYLRNLIKRPTLKHSELLCTFLSSKQDFEEEQTSFGKLLRKSVVPNLRKERGQDLETFINSFMTSCTLTKYEWKDIGGKSNFKRDSVKDYLHICGNNFDLDSSISQKILSDYIDMPKIDDFFLRPSTSIIYMAISIYKLPRYVAKFLLSFQSLFGSAIDQICLRIMRNFFKNIFTPSNIAFLVSLVNETLFYNKNKQSYSETRLEFMDYLDTKKKSWFYPLCIVLHEIMQDAKMNKQLFYQLFDLTLEELFPELKSNRS